MDLLTTCVLFYLQLYFTVTGLQPLKKLPVITVILRLSHLIWLCTVVFLIFYRRLSGGDTSVGGLVGTASFVCNGSVNIIILLESKCKCKYFLRIRQLEKEIDHLIDEKWNIKVNQHLNYSRMMKRTLSILCLLSVCDSLKIWINAISKIQPVFWYTFPITISLRTRYIQIISIIMKLNGRVEIFKKVLIASTKNNEPTSKYFNDIWQPYTEKEYSKVNYMRLIYLRIWEMYKAVNDCFSWSMLLLFMTSFFDIVCNCYWTFTAIYKRQKFHKYVFNGATSMSLASLVIMLFYYTDTSDYNLSFCFYYSHIMLYFRNHLFLRSTNPAFIITMFCSHFTLWLFALTPFTNSYLIYQLYMLLWFGEILTVCYIAVTYDIIDDENMNSLVSSVVFIVHVVGHFVILLDSWMMHDYRLPIYEKFFHLRNTLQRNLLITYDKRKMEMKLIEMVILFGCVLMVDHGLIIWTTFETNSFAAVFYWNSLPSVLALQFKTLEFLLAMVQVNHCIMIMRENINEIGERNLKRIFNMATMKKPAEARVKFIQVLPQRHQNQEDEKQVEMLKSAYNDIYEMLQLLSRAYGWSLLAITAVDFVVFICNTYWILLSVISHSMDYFSLLQNACFALMGFILLTLLCWICEQAQHESRYIGCLISKLVKPLGNKRYNDLVSEFSVQTLHQRFIITAKEFFNLNLGLLGSMVAAIVTYLVILIQFMFTENNNDNKLPKGGSLVTSTMTPNLLSIIATPTTTHAMGGNFTLS